LVSSVHESFWDCPNIFKINLLLDIFCSHASNGARASQRDNILWLESYSPDEGSKITQD